MNKYYKIEYCYIGFVLVVSSNSAIVSVDIEDSIEPLLKKIEKNSDYRLALSVFDNPDVESWFDATFDFIEYPSTSSCKNIPVELSGTDYQQKVYKALMMLEVGETISYSELAKRLGDTKASRAVAKAVASNNIAFLVPCHRVINKNGTFGKYKWGRDKKEMILNKESLK